MCVDFVLLANGTIYNEVVDECGQPGPPEVSFYEGFGAESSCMAKGGGLV